jgi:Spy/CpxP family protein refolding chaperone
MIDAKVLILAVAAGGAGLAGLGTYAAYAHGGLAGHGRFAGHRHEMAHKFIEFVVNEKLDQVGATDAQKEKVRAVRERLMAQGKALHGDKEALHRELLSILEQDNPDPARIKALAHERIAALSRFADDAADALVEVHGVLTPEQRQKLLADLRTHMERHRR